MSEPATEEQQRAEGAAEPVEPAEPTEPTESVDPAEPTEPTESVDPAEPAEPTYARFDCTDPELVAKAAEAARHAVEAGECVVLPTDTVYGIGADAFNAKAVQRLLDAKGRGRDMPPPVLIADAGLIRALASDVPSAAETLTAAFWPGALTIIVSARSSARMDLGDTEGTIALRVPDHELARTLLRQTGPMAVSSANRSGRPAALDCDEAIEQLGDSVAVYLDGGRLGDAGRPPSTIVDFSASDHGRLLRQGAISLTALREVCPEIEELSAGPDAEGDAGRTTRPTGKSWFTLQPPRA